MNSTLSLNEAATRAGLTRWPVSRALQAGSLRGIRDNRGRWRIDAADLDRWAAEHVRTEPHVELHGADTVPALAVEVASLTARLEASEARSEELAQERNRLLALIERLSEPRPSFLDRLLGIRFGTKLTRA